MDIARPPKRSPRESVVPMINVVFLLLIFFLMTAQITPPEPFEVKPPRSEAETPAEGQRILYIDADGKMALGDLEGEAIFAGLGEFDKEEPLLIRADRGAEALVIAQLLPKLAAAGVGQVKLISTAK